ncbi:hypothetical protein B0T25DRAFT_140846 [Lasiosphaeria hispida]|uniref:HNH nuclease domain-containing protein n=1 Tax=Lasiosphaeria hispida TaxID=260671 RepID=A0AAJ0HLN0_9PEZI|nr:hypothetical protein B0T25DRAFT_140846 [Lasiosphaeria hispida]
MLQSATPSGPPQIPQRTSSKRSRREVEKEYAFLKSELDEAKKKVRPSTSFDASYWISAAVACDALTECLHAETKLAVRNWVENGEGSAASWWATQEARRIIEQIKAATLEKSLYTKQAEKIKQGGPMRRSFQALFMTSQIGICAEKVGMGSRTRSEQSKFKDDLIQFYGAAMAKPNKPKVIVSIHDSASGHDLVKSSIVAAHLFPHKLGPDILIALFGEDVEGELMTARNGLLLQRDVESALDDGAIAIVPDLPDDPFSEQVASWEEKEPKDYRWRIIDDDADSLETIFLLKNQGAPKDMTIRDLDGQKLSFKNDNRPRARYLYFLFVVAQLKMAWRHEYRKDPAKKLKSQLGKGFWATKGQYLNPGWLAALADEIGHDTSFLDNKLLPGDDSDGDVGLIAIAKIIGSQKRGNEEDEEEEEL